MTNSVTIQSDDDSGNSYEITLMKTGADTGAIEIKKVTSLPEDHRFDVSDIRANSEGTQLVCKANIIFSPKVTCSIDEGAPDSPSVSIDVDSFVAIHEKYAIKLGDFKTLTQFVAGAGFPALN
jgi:hypothetical protein